MKKLLSLSLVFFGLYSTIINSIYTYSYTQAFLFPKSYQTIAETIFVSWLIVFIKISRTITLYLISHYGASSLFKIRRKYASNTWLYIGVFAVVLYFLEYLAWSMPLRPVDGFEETTSFLSRFLDALIYHSNHNISQFITFSLFFGLFSIYKKEVK